MRFSWTKKLNIKQQKANDEIRHQALTFRRSLTEINKNHFDKLIQEKLLTYINRHQIKSVALYYPTEGEVDTLPIIEELLKNNITVGLPQVISKELMVFRQINNLEFEFEYFKNIKQPTISNPEMMVNQIKLLVMPLLAYDYELWRLGYGMGYYDRFLKLHDHEDKIIKIGLAYSGQRFAKFHTHPYDRKVTMVINEKEIVGRK